MNKSQPPIPYGKHAIDAADIAAVVDVLENKFLTQGEMVPEFEQKLSEYCASQHATAVNSGTSGLHVACLAAGVGEGDRVWTVPNSFVASANCARYCGAEVDFVDIDPVSRNISVTALAEKLDNAKQQLKLPKVLIVVHFAGLSCDMASIRNLTEPFGIIIIEDAAHGLGGEYKGEKIGSCRYSDMAVMSFHPVKSITTAEGGAVLTNDLNLHKRIQLFAKHGVTRDHAQMVSASEGPWYYQQLVLGYNYRLSDMQAALGTSQLARLDQFVHARQRIAAKYSDAWTGLPVALPTIPDDCQSAWHLYMIELLDHDRAEVFERLKAAGLGVNVHYIPIHLQPYYRDLGFKAGDFPCAEQFYQRAITMPLFPTMTEDEQQRVIDTVIEVVA